LLLHDEYAVHVPSVVYWSFGTVLQCTF